MSELPSRYPPALCNRCRHMGEAAAEANRKHYVACTFPVRLPAVMLHNGLGIGEWDRLIPRRELVGFSDSSRYNNCPTFEIRFVKIKDEQTAKPSKGVVATEPVDDTTFRIVDLLKPFRVGEAL